MAAQLRGELKSVEADLDTSEVPATLADAVAAIGVDSLLGAPRGFIGSPWPRLTERINDGMRPGELWIVAARPSVGKTTFALQWALEAAKAEKRVLFCLTGMPVADLLKRAISARGGIHHGALMRGDA
ncbi:MAG: AAA family ATPase [Bryobacterales bacterium]|nr:AAA family ATPase [Bryobacterales bacterium]